MGSRALAHPHHLQPMRVADEPAAEIEASPGFFMTGEVGALVQIGRARADAPGPDTTRYGPFHRQRWRRHRAYTSPAKLAWQSADNGTVYPVVNLARASATGTTALPWKDGFEGKASVRVKSVEALPGAGRD